MKFRAQRRRARALAGLALLALLGACATRPPAPTPEILAAWDRHQAGLVAVYEFSLAGRFAAGGVFGTKGQVNWNQAGSDYRVRLWGPFGAGAVLINGSERRTEIRTADERFETTDAEAALRERFGWTLPIGHLRWWVLGVPAPGTRAAMQFDGQGRLGELQQSGWTVKYQEYQAVDERELPRRIALANDEVSVKLVVDAWSGLP